MERPSRLMFGNVLYKTCVQGKVNSWFSRDVKKKEKKKLKFVVFTFIR